MQVLTPGSSPRFWTQLSRCPQASYTLCDPPEESLVRPNSGQPPIPGHMVQAIKARKYMDLADLLPEALQEMQFDDTREMHTKDDA